jgi:membrane-bound lytic murein transglycosylase A
MDLAARRPSLLRALTALLLALLSGCAATQEKDFNAPLPFGAAALIPIEDTSQWPDLREGYLHREELLVALDRSLDWTRSAHAAQFFPVEGVTHERALRSLERFRELLVGCESAREFEDALRREFLLHRSAGYDGRGGGVLFTGYYTPILDGRLARDDVYRHPLYALPGDLVKGEHGQILGQQTEAGLRPYPGRSAIEAAGLLAGQGLELVWFRDPLDAFLAHVNGSAFVRVEDGRLVRFGYAGNNGREYTSLAKELVRDGEIPADHSGIPSLRAWAARNPGKVQEYLNRNERFVFFAPIEGNPRGSLNLEVEAGRSLATDKSLFPRGALVFVQTHTPGASLTGGPIVRQFLLDQDTGGAIRTAGRADIYLGIGEEAGAAAGEMKAEGQMYYVFLRE